MAQQKADVDAAEQSIEHSQKCVACMLLRCGFCLFLLARSQAKFADQADNGWVVVSTCRRNLACLAVTLEEQGLR